MSAKRIINSILACRFDDEACCSVESNSGSMQSIIDAMERSELLAEDVLSPTQIAIYLAYMHRFAVAFGHERVLPLCKGFVYHSLDTRDSELAAVLSNFVVTLIKRDDAMRDYIFEFYFLHQDNSTVLQIIIKYANQSAKQFFDIVSQFMENPQQRISALHLIASVIKNHGPHLHEIMSTRAFSTLLVCIEVHDIASAFALRVLTMLLPFLLSVLPPVLDRLFTILIDVLCTVSEDKTQAGDLFRKSALLYLYHLYGVFPSCLLAFLRNKVTANLINKVKLVLAQLPFNVYMLRGKNYELSLDRWKGLTPQQIAGICFEDFGFINIGEDTDIWGVELQALKNNVLQQRHNIVFDKHLIVPGTDIVDGNATNSPSTNTNITSSIESTNYEGLHRKIEILAQELLWMEYVAGLYQRRAVEIARDSLQTWMKRDTEDATELAAKATQREIESLRNSIKRVNQKLAETEAEHRAWSEKAFSRITTLETENRKLKEECVQLACSYGILKDKADTLENSLQAKIVLNMDADVKLREVLTQLAVCEDENKKLRVMHDDLLSW